MSEEEEVEETRIPLDTLARLFETAAFEHQETRITEQALELSAEYLRMFVKEALVRANEDRENPRRDNNSNTTNGVVDNQLIKDVLDTENLENIAGLLVMDF